MSWRERLRTAGIIAMIAAVIVFGVFVGAALFFRKIL